MATNPQLKREWRQQDIERLRQLWDAGIASGSAGHLDMKKLRREARERLKGAMKAAGNARWTGLIKPRP
jgi:antitoxin ParD1/3/4